MRKTFYSGRKEKNRDISTLVDTLGLAPLTTIAPRQCLGTPVLRDKKKKEGRKQGMPHPSNLPKGKLGLTRHS